MSVLALPFTFHDPKLELRFNKQFHRVQALTDLVICSLAAFTFSSVAWQAYHTSPMAAAYAIILVMLNLMPITALALNARDYPMVRHKMMAVMVVLGWHFDFQVGLHLTKLQPAPKMPPPHLPSRLQRWLALLPSRVPVLAWVNLSQRMPFLLHAPAHALGLLVEFRSTAERCRWAPQPQLQPLAAFMRRATLVKPPAPESFGGSKVGICAVSINFLQVTLGYLLPCYVALVLELKSRISFLADHYERRQRRRQQQQRQIHYPPLGPPWLVVTSLLRPRALCWMAAIALPCWRLAEVTAVYFAG